MIDALFADESAYRFDLPEESEVVGDGFILLEPSKDDSRSHGDSEYDHSGADFLNREEYARKVYNALDIELDLPEHGKLVVNGRNKPLEEVREEICKIAKYTGVTDSWRVRRGMSTPDVRVRYQEHVQSEADEITEAVRKRLAYHRNMEPVDPEEIEEAVAIEAGARVPSLKPAYQAGRGLEEDSSYSDAGPDEEVVDVFGPDDDGPYLSNLGGFPLSLPLLLHNLFPRRLWQCRLFFSPGFRDILLSPACRFLPHCLRLQGLSSVSPASPSG